MAKHRAEEETRKQALAKHQAAEEERKQAIALELSLPKLVDCADCGKSVSRRASQCPHCGCPIVGANSPTTAVKAPLVPGTVGGSLPPQSSTPPVNSGGGSGTSIVLFLIGGILLIIAFIINVDLDKKEKNDGDMKYAAGNLGGSLTGRYEYKETKKEDRISVYATGGIGAIFILGGIVILGSTKK